MLFGSLSHLVRVGTIIYALQWVMLVNKVGIRWPGVKICPLPFILAHEIIGSAGSNMSELACWYSMVYSGDTQGLKDTWELLLKQVKKNSRNIQPLRYEESYCIPLPRSLSSSVTTAQVFVCKTSTATTVTAFMATECMEIVHFLRLELGRDFSVSLSPQDILLRNMGKPLLRGLRTTSISTLLWWVPATCARRSPPLGLRGLWSTTSPTGEW